MSENELNASMCVPCNVHAFRDTLQVQCDEEPPSNYLFTDYLLSVCVYVMSLSTARALRRSQFLAASYAIH